MQYLVYPVWLSTCAPAGRPYPVEADTLEEAKEKAQKGLPGKDTGYALVLQERRRILNDDHT